MFQTTNQIIINIKHPINVICPMITGIFTILMGISWYIISHHY